MGNLLRTFFAAFAAVYFWLAVSAVGLADEAAVRMIVSKFADAKGFSAVEEIIDELGALGDLDAAMALNALSDGELMIRQDNKTIVIERNAKLYDPVTDEELGGAAGIDLKKVRIKNSLRRAISTALSGMTLRAADPAIRKQAVQTIFQTGDSNQAEALEAAIKAERDESIKREMMEARASITLKTSTDERQLAEAIRILGDRGDREALALLSSYVTSAKGAGAELANAQIARINKNLAYWDIGQNVWYGLSLGSVLFLAAIGLAITFGVMGVINMAHGEMVMLGAYTTFVVQEFIRQSSPGLFDYSLAFALPLAFLVTALVGIAMEGGIIRFLYGRPLETLLATWGVSLILQQTVRTIFGPTNREVGNPEWMSGVVEVGQIAVTWNRLWILVFSLAVFALLMVVLNKTSLGLQMRAVTQNRRMASSMGIRTNWVDAMTFALGSGIAGIAGVALSQIDNVSPNLGQGYIIDSFMVVVFGGVGNLWGTLVGAMTLGVANKFLEPYAGAVLAKILVLVFIILFIQRRPRGLFALRGRAVEA